MKMRESAAYAVGATAFILCATFAAFAIWIHQAVEHNAYEQALLRTAQIERARLIRLQLDEETGIRGYVLTRKTLFLEPYATGRRHFGATAATLRTTLTDLGMDDRLVREQEEINAQWLIQCAHPSLADPKSVDFITQLRSKALIDGSRRLDVALFGQLTARAEAADTAVSTLVTRLLLASILIGLVLALVFAIIAAWMLRIIAKLEEQRKAYEQEKRVADTLQTAFRGKALPETEGTILHAVYMPAGVEAKVGGDWYDVFKLREDYLLFSIGDVAGHGIDAAVVMSRARQSILTIGIQESNPATVLERTNRILNMQEATMVTAICGFVDLTRHTVTYASAAHPPMMLLPPNGEVQMLATGGPPLGILPDTAYQSCVTPILPNSMLVLYTDGLVEYSHDLLAGERTLMDALRQLDPTSPNPASTILGAIFRERSPNDDVAILTIRFPDAGSNAILLQASIA